MGLRAPFRGRGLGARLLDETLKLADARPIARVELDVFASNTAAIALYEGRGFVREGLLRRGRIIDGTVDDVVVMARFAP